MLALVSGLQDYSTLSLENYLVDLGDRLGNSDLFFSKQGPESVWVFQVACLSSPIEKEIAVTRDISYTRSLALCLTFIK